MSRLRRHIALFLFVTVTVSAPGQSGTTDLDSIRRLLPTLTDHELFKAHFILAQATEGTYPLEAAEHAKKALVIATRLGKRDTVPTLYATLSFTAAQLGDFKEALSNGYTSLDLATALGNKRNIASAHSTLGITYGYLGQYSKALEHHEEAFRIREEIGWYYGASRTLNNIGIVYHNMGQYDKAIEYYNEVQKRRGFETDTLSLIRYHQNVGFAELRRGNLDTAIALQRIALDMSERFHFTNGKAYSLYNLGLIEIEKKEYPKAVIDLLRSLAHYHQLGQKHGSVQVLNALGIAAHGAKDDVNAIRYLHEAASLASSIGAADELKKAYETLTMLYDRRGETATAYRYYKLFTAAKDSVFNSKESNRITDLLLRIERQKKERELELLRAESEHALHEQELRGYALIGGLGLLSGIVILLVLYIRRIREGRRIAESRKEEVEGLNRQLQEKMQEVKVLSGLLPICSHCKKIRNDEGYWQNLEGYISDHSHATFTHGICPDCRREHFGRTLSHR